MQTMETIQIRLPRDTVKTIDSRVRRGIFKSRSDAIRDTLDRMEFLTGIDKLQSILENGGYDKKKLLRALEKEREKTYRRFL